MHTAKRARAIRAKVGSSFKNTKVQINRTNTEIVPARNKKEPNGAGVRDKSANIIPNTAAISTQNEILLKAFIP